VAHDAGKRRRWWSRLLLPAVVLGLAALINVFLFTTVAIRGSSMEPALQDGERVLVPRWEYWWQRLAGGGYGRGDIVFYPDPTAEQCRLLCGYVIKRIVGLPGEHLEIEDGQVRIDGRDLDEPWLDGAWEGSFSLDGLTVPPGEYFMLGDNRYPYGSHDSRTYGTVPAAAVAGRAAVVLWPPGRAGRLPAGEQ